MNEGYFQMKMSDLDEQLKQMKNEATTLGYQIQGVERKVGDYDILLEKLNDLDTFRKDMSETLKQQDEVLFKSCYETLLDALVNDVNTCFKKEMENIHHFLTEIQKAADNLDDFKTGINYLSFGVDRHECFLFNLIRQLRKKNIFTDKEVEQIIDAVEREHKKKLREHKRK